MGRAEPSADMRQAARAAREMFLAMVEQGFTEDQAIKLVALAMGQAASGGSSGDK